MKIKTYKIYCKKEDAVLYNLSVQKSKAETFYTLSTSEWDQWTVQNSVVFQVKDSGNGWSFSSSEAIDSAQVDYCTLEYMRIILNFATKTDNLAYTYTVLGKKKFKV